MFVWLGRIITFFIVLGILVGLIFFVAIPAFRNVSATTPGATATPPAPAVASDAGVSAVSGDPGTMQGPVYPAPTPQPLPGVIIGLLPIDEFAQMWETTPVDQPGTLILALNREWDKGAAYLGQGRQQSEVGDWVVKAGSILWTDLLMTEVTRADDGSELQPGDFIPLRTQGRWGVYAVYVDVHIDTPGRAWSTDRQLNPEKDLSGWATNK